MYAFLKTPRWIIATIVVALIAVLLVNLGFWQIRRLHWRRGVNATITAHEHLPAVPVDDLAGQPLDDIQYRRVTATGTYDTAHELVLFGRPNGNSGQGNHVLTPLTADGLTVIVDRGWVPLSMDPPPVANATPPPGTVTVTGILLPPEADGSAPPPSRGQVKNVNLDQLASATGVDILPAYLLLQTQDPPQSGDLPQVAETPPLSEGPHFSYAVQWFLFTIIGLIGYAALVRKEARERARAAAPDPAD
jgi:cytochrome oxidase assembly protein ShyY1